MDLRDREDIVAIADTGHVGLAARPRAGDAAGRLLTLVWRETCLRPSPSAALAGLIRGCLEPALAGADAAAG